MNKLLKRYFSLLFILVFSGFIMSGCAGKDLGTKTNSTNNQSQNTSSEKKLKFAYSIMSLDNPYFISVKNGFEEQCKNLGATSVVVDAKYDVAKQVSDIENLIEQGVDGLMISPIDQKALQSVVEKAKQKGIPVVSEAQSIDNANANYVVDEYKYGVVIGTNAAKWINEKLGGKAEVVIISQDNVEPVIQRGNGIQDTILKLCPGSKIVARQAGDTPEKGMKIVESVLQRFPNVKVITGNNDSGALGGYEAAMALGKASTDFYVGGGDATAEAISKMKEPNSIYRATVDILPYQSGKDCVDLLAKYKKNGLPEKAETIIMKMNPVLQDDVVTGKYKPEN